MKIVPEHKSDTEACEKLNAATDDEIINVLPELLEWLQDINWPVSGCVVNRIHSLGTPLIKPTKKY